MPINDLHIYDLKNATSPVMVLRVSGTPYPQILTAKDIASCSDRQVYRWWDEDVEPSVEVNNGVAVVRVNGFIRPETSGAWWAATAGVEELIDETIRLADSANITRTVFRMTTGGGLADRIEDFREAVKYHQEKKPIDAFCSDMVASGGYWMISGFDSIYCDRLAQIGSLGVFAVLLDTSKMMEEMGVFSVLINDNPLGVKGHWALDEITDTLVNDTLRKIMETSKIFRESVKEGRGFSDEKTDEIFTGELWTGENAQEIGLVDGVLPWFQYIRQLTEDPGLILQSNRGDSKESSETKGDKDIMKRREPEEVRSALEVLTGFVSAGFGKKPTKHEGAKVMKENHASVNGKDYMMQSARDQMRAYVSEKMASLSATPGVKSIPGLAPTLCLLGTFSVFGDTQKDDTEKVSSCASVYDLAEREGWDSDSLFALAMEMWDDVSDPFSTILSALGSSPQFLAADTRFKNFARSNGGNQAAAVAPTGGGLGVEVHPREVGNDPEKPFSSMTPANQELVKYMSQGLIVDDRSYLSYNPRVSPVPERK